MEDADVDEAEQYAFRCHLFRVAPQVANGMPGVQAQVVADLATCS